MRTWYFFNISIMSIINSLYMYVRVTFQGSEASSDFFPVAESTTTSSFIDFVDAEIRDSSEQSANVDIEIYDHTEERYILYFYMLDQYRFTS